MCIKYGLSCVQVLVRLRAYLRAYLRTHVRERQWVSNTHDKHDRAFLIYMIRTIVSISYAQSCGFDKNDPHDRARTYPHASAQSIFRIEPSLFTTSTYFNYILNSLTIFAASVKRIRKMKEML